MDSRRNNSKKRAAILNALSATKAHPSAEMLHAALRRDDPELGIATVYRNLAILQEDGYIQSVGKVNGQERYDADLHPHGHFVCIRCGAVMDLEFSGDEAVSQFGKLLPSGSRIDRMELRISGTCPGCTSLKS